MKKKLLSFAALRKTRKLSYKQNQAFLANFTENDHWCPRLAALRSVLLENPGIGELSFRKMVSTVTCNLFHHIRQWPYFVESRQGMQYFFIDFFFPKLGLCVEIDGENHSESYQNAWDVWRTDLIKSSSLEVVRYHANSISKEAFLSDVALYAPIRYKKQLICLYHKHKYTD